MQHLQKTGGGGPPPFDVSTCRRSGVQTRVRSIPSIFSILQPYLHNGRCPILLESIRYAHFSSRRRVYLPSPRFDPDLVGTFNLGLEAAVPLQGEKDGEVPTGSPRCSGRAG